MMTSSRMPGVYTGQVERDANGDLWAVLYDGEQPSPDTTISREEVRSERAGRRVVAEMVIGRADATRRKPRWPWNSRSAD